MMAKLGPYLPNTHRQPLAIVPVIKGAANAKAWIPAKFFQIIGGKSWSLSIVRLKRMEVSEDGNDTE